MGFTLKLCRLYQGLWSREPGSGGGQPSLQSFQLQSWDVHMYMGFVVMDMSEPGITNRHTHYFPHPVSQPCVRTISLNSGVTQRLREVTQEPGV